jgi:hypothetical protein
MAQRKFFVRKKSNNQLYIKLSIGTVRKDSKNVTTVSNLINQLQGSQWITQ